MASIDSLTNHRLRHLNGLSVRNLVLGEDESPPFSVCFALSLPHGDDLGFFYRSLDEWNCLHPDWRYIDLSGCSHLQQTTKDFVVSVLIRSENTGIYRLLRQWRIHITGLRRMQDAIPPKDALKGSDEFLILQFGETFFTTYQADHDKEPITAEVNNSSLTSGKMDLKLFPRADESSIKKSYNLEFVKRISKLADEHLRINESVKQEQEKCLDSYTRTQSARHQKCELETKRSRISILQQQVNRARERLKTRMTRVKQIKEKNDKKEEQLLVLKEEIKTKNENLQTATNVYQRLRSDLKEYQVQIVRRRLVLARALHIIYPIKKVTSETPSSTPSYSICNLPLPDSDDFSDNSFREAHFTAAYGYCAQLLRLLSYITDVPLRYPIVIHKSLLHVRDNIVCQLEHEERNFPLQLKRHKTDRIRFAYAVFLINRDISLLRLACGLSIKKMSSTLYNVSELIRSPLTPKCSAETYNAAEKLIEEGSKLSLFPPQNTLPSVVGESSVKSITGSRATASGINSDIYFHGDAVDLTT